MYQMIEKLRKHSYRMSDRKTATVSTAHFISVTASTDPEYPENVYYLKSYLSGKLYGCEILKWILKY